MPRNRLTRALLLIAGLVLVTYVLISLYLPSSRSLTFGVDKHTGVVRVVQQNITFLPPHQFYRLRFEKREGYAQRDGIVRIDSKEGVPVTVNYRLRFGISGDNFPDAQRMVAEGWNAWMRARVGEAVSEVTKQIPIEDLLSPSSQFNSQRDPMRQSVANHLAKVGLKVTAFEVARFEVDRDALLRFKRAELRRDARSSPTRVVIFALDGADWELLHELSDDGRIPNIRALSAGGMTASLQTIQPTVSPMVWTTVATGLTPDRHGVLDFMDRGHHTPVDAYSRRVPALWDIADAFGRSALVTGWWAAWPPTAPNSVFYDTPVQESANAVYPQALAERAGSLAVQPDTVGYAQMRRFLNITTDEWDAASKNPSDPAMIVRSILAKTWNDHRVAINLYNDQRQHGQDPMLVMVSYEGTDAVNHLFAPYHPPYREGISEASYRKYWPAVANYYAEVDRLIGEWMGVLPRDATVMIMSSYGFRWGKNRPRSMPNGGAALSDHRNPGMFVAYGPHVVPNHAAQPMSVYDVAPSVLSLLGLPQAMDMPGHVTTWAFKDVAPITSVRVVSYGEFVNSKPVITSPQVPEAPYARELQAIGHLNDPAHNLTPVLEDEDQDARQRAAAPLTPERWGQYAYYNNLGIDLRGKGKLSDAVDAFDRAIDINPTRPTPHLNEAMTMFDRQQYTPADEQFLKAVALGLPNAESYFIDFAALYREKNMDTRAIVLLYQGKRLFPQSYLIAANLGSALLAAQRYSEGVPELVRALGLQPSSTLALNNLGLFYAKQNDYGRALDFWNRSLSIEPHQPQIRDAAMAARSRL